MRAGPQKGARLTLGEHFPWMLVIGVFCVALVVVFAYTAQSTSRDPSSEPTPCDWDAELLRALSARGEHPPDWTITPDSDGPGDAWVSYMHLTATISRDVACADVRSVVNHEWMHLQQARLYGGQQAEAMYSASPDWMEWVADCGSMLLGSQNLPYLQRGGVDVCTTDVLAESRRLIDYQPGPAN